jgi:hypothetical protein
VWSTLAELVEHKYISSSIFLCGSHVFFTVFVDVGEQIDYLLRDNLSVEGLENISEGGNRSKLTLVY